MTKFSLFLCVTCILAFAACTGRQNASTTPEGPKDGKPDASSGDRANVPSGPSSDLCSGTACPGVVR